MRVKFFSGAQFNRLEDSINNWMEEYRPFVMSMNTSMFETGKGKSHLVVSILYKEPTLPAEERVRIRGDELPGNSPKCPMCGAGMVMRTRHADGEPFWGCTQFPKCRGIEPFDEQDKVATGLVSDGNSAFSNSGLDDDDDDDIPF